ncbi:MAG: hypothetical protein IJS22_05880 [Lachnospiraceae bacterium]|nr:hypothetical protein [Lachnospiraceae bacterium]
MEKTYLAGPMFRKTKILCIVLVEIVVFIFFFIYQYIFGTRVEGYNPNYLIAIFMFLAALFWFAVDRISEKIRETIRYVITRDSFKMGLPGKEKVIPWTDFVAIRLEPFNNRLALPVQFVVKNPDYEPGKKLQKELDINNTVEDIYGLTRDVLMHVDREVTEVDPELEARLDAARIMGRSK